MIFKTVFNGLLLLQAFSLIMVSVNTKTMYDYEFTLDEVNMSQPCGNPNTTLVGRYFNASALKLWKLENGSIRVRGAIEVAPDIPVNAVMPVSSDFYRKQRGTWQNTIYNFHRADLCKAIFDPTEMWYKLLSSIPVEERVCPFYGGQKLSLDVTLDTIYKLPSPNLAGEYMIEYIVTSNDFDKPLCSNVFTEVFRN